MVRRRVATAWILTFVFPSQVRPLGTVAWRGHFVNWLKNP
jgi:hypothetical protein